MKPKVPFSVTEKTYRQTERMPDLQTKERMPEPKSSVEEWFAISKTSVSVLAYRLQSLESHMFHDIQPL